MNAKYFSKLQNNKWYLDFLNPIFLEVSEKSKVLDIGTGPGKLLELLLKRKQIQAYGVDSNSEMLSFAKKRLSAFNVDLRRVEKNKCYPFANESFDCISICNVLHNLKREEQKFILTEAKRLLRAKGKIIILTPSANGTILSLAIKLFNVLHVNLFIWYRATKKRSKVWWKEEFAKEFSLEEKLNYDSYFGSKGFSRIEILEK